MYQAANAFFFVYICLMQDRAFCSRNNWNKGGTVQYVSKAT